MSTLDEWPHLPFSFSLSLFHSLPLNTQRDTHTHTWSCESAVEVNWLRAVTVIQCHQLWCFHYISPLSVIHPKLIFSFFIIRPSDFSRKGESLTWARETKTLFCILFSSSSSRAAASASTATIARSLQSSTFLKYLYSIEDERYQISSSFNWHPSKQ